ncbi:hypothetical protein Ciccas_004410 [Cichlidogyrus casuarinus]|uniref:Uncharacterized protein n=1 Tax=Cichlidogyrus casuarinus TaxID=1844966 RepID=A0ABD2QCF5_9PLAT
MDLLVGEELRVSDAAYDLEKFRTCRSKVQPRSGMHSIMCPPHTKGRFVVLTVHNSWKRSASAPYDPLQLKRNFFANPFANSRDILQICEMAVFSKYPALKELGRARRSLEKDWHSMIPLKNAITNAIVSFVIVTIH